MTDETDTGVAPAAGPSPASQSGAERFPMLSPDEMSPAQRAVAEVIMAGPRKGLPGPFNAWLRSPELTERLQRVGDYLRFNSALPDRIKEIAILVAGQAWDAEFELYAHRKLALKAGLAPGVVDALVEGARPTGLAADEAAVYDFVTELRRTHKVGDATYRAAHQILGDLGVIDLIALSGYYDLVSMTLNVAQVRAPVETAH